MRRCVISLFLLLPAVTMANAEILFDTGKSEYRIVLAKDATPVERSAAGELQLFLKKSTGATLPITAQRSGPSIFVGQSEIALKALGLKSWKELKPDEIRLKNRRLRPLSGW